MNRGGALIAVVAGLVTFGASSEAHADKRLHFWMHAFIPDKHPQLADYIFEAAPRRHVLHAPAFSIKATERALAGTCFLGDSRSYDTSPTSSARVTIEFDLVFSGRNMIISSHDGRERVRVSPSENVNCGNGTTISRRADTSYVADIGEVRSSRFIRTMAVRVSAGNPYFDLAPRIDISLSFQYFILERKLRVVGTTGYFPSFEAYYQFEGDDVQRIIQWGPYGDSTALSLVDLNLGLNSRNFEHEIVVGRVGN